MEIGKTYYIIAHSYFHYIGEVVEYTPRSVTLNRVVQVHSCGRSWTRFFAEGFGNDTKYDHWPDGTVVPTGLPYTPWNHPIPSPDAEEKRR